MNFAKDDFSSLAVLMTIFLHFKLKISALKYQYDFSGRSH